MVSFYVFLTIGEFYKIRSDGFEQIIRKGNMLFGIFSLFLQLVYS